MKVNKHICNGCANGLGHSRPYLIKMIEQYDPGEKSEGILHLKHKLLRFFGVDLNVLSIEESVKELAEEVYKLKRKVEGG